MTFECYNVEYTCVYDVLSEYSYDRIYESEA